MPINSSAHQLAALVKTTLTKALVLEQAHTVATELGKVTPPTAQAIQTKYPFLHKLLLECYPQTGTIADQKTLDRLLTDLATLEELTVTLPAGVSGEAVAYELQQWLSEYAKDPVIVHANVSSDVVSGLTLSFRGHFCDLSLAKLVSDKVYA
jgi:hypothetical protein